MSKTIQITVEHEDYFIEANTSLYEFSKQFQSSTTTPIVLSRVNGRLTELFQPLTDHCSVEWICLDDRVGRKVYERTAIFLLCYAVSKVFGQKAASNLIVDYTIGNGMFCKFNDNYKCSDEDLNKIKSIMQSAIKERRVIQKKNVSIGEAVALFKQAHMEDKVNLFKYRRASNLSIYYLDDYFDYNYGYLVCFVDRISMFELNLFDDGFVLVLPEEQKPFKLLPFKSSDKLNSVLKEASGWGETMGINSVSELNDLIASHQFNELILVQEALQEKRIGQIAEQIISQPSKRIVLIAGPSSSGKTTFSHRLSIQLRAYGMHPYPIAVDDYFVNREFTPIDEDGKPDFESLRAVDVDLFNEHMSALLRGEEVELPRFNFMTGSREYSGRKLKISDKDILIIEGIHCLNDQLTYSIHSDSKFKIYISALTQLNLDHHTRIPTTDGRLIRRIVRDASKRASDASKTISMWHSVRRGEEENIFPYQEDADIMFNSVLIYELAVLKQYAEPLLFAVSSDSKEYEEAKRLLKFLDYFVGVPNDMIPQNSILREFIGGSCFKDC